MTVDYAHNRSADAARTLKAAYIMDACHAAGLDADAAAHLDAKGRRAMEKAAGTRRGSDDTWLLVVTLMAREGRPRRAPSIEPPVGLDAWG